MVGIILDKTSIQHRIGNNATEKASQEVAVMQYNMTTRKRASASDEKTRDE